MSENSGKGRRRIGGRLYEVAEATDGCEGCGLWDKARGTFRCAEVEEACKWFTRGDRRNVIFRRIKG